MNIRQVKLSDTINLLSIYEQYIDTNITFEYQLPSEEEFRKRIQQISSKYPYLICEKENKIIGYAYAHEFNSRIAYQYSSEVSIYIDKNCLNQHIGTKLYSQLFKYLQNMNIKTVYACITANNKTSAVFHEKLGFKKCATFHKAGFKNASWLDVDWFEKSIADYE